MTCYLVASPEYAVYPGDDVDPTEYGRDALYVRATSRQRAKVLAVRAWRRLTRMNYLLRQQLHIYHRIGRWLDDGENPFVGMTVAKIDEVEMRRALAALEAEDL